MLTCRPGRRGRAAPGPSCCTTGRRTGRTGCRSICRRSTGSGCCRRCTPCPRWTRCPRRPPPCKNPRLENMTHKKRATPGRAGGRREATQATHARRNKCTTGEREGGGCQGVICRCRLIEKSDTDTCGSSPKTPKKHQDVRTVIDVNVIHGLSTRRGRRRAHRARG